MSVTKKDRVSLGEKIWAVTWIKKKKKWGQWLPLEPGRAGSGRNRGMLPDGPILFPNKIPT